MSVPYTFASATTPIPLAELDVNFATPIVLGGTSMNLGGSYTEVDGLTLGSATLITPALGTPASGNLANCSGYTYANLGGTVPTWNQNTTGNAATADTANTAVSATTATQIYNAGGWNVTPSGTKLLFSYNGVTIASLSSTGAFVAVDNVTAFGTP